MLASESVASDQLGFTSIEDIKSGQAVIVPMGGPPIFRQVHPQLSYTQDIFEFCYFSREDSVIDGISVYDARQNMGRKLADTVRKMLGKDVVDGIDIGSYTSNVTLKSSVELIADHSCSNTRFGHRPRFVRCRIPQYPLPPRILSEPLYFPHLHYACPGKTSEWCTVEA
jgi:glutamine phosphoribosylpyrophosphate amidotransferase